MKLPASSGRVSSGIPPKPTRLRSMSFGAVRLAIHPCGKPQGILAKANKPLSYPMPNLNNKALKNSTATGSFRFMLHI